MPRIKYNKDGSLRKGRPRKALPDNLTFEEFQMITKTPVITLKKEKQQLQEKADAGVQTAINRIEKIDWTLKTKTQIRNQYRPRHYVWKDDKWHGPIMDKKRAFAMVGMSTEGEEEEE
jgi:hypothetical protein